jgi:RNA polymerase sigma-70 factor, ECF subfamily
MCLSLPVRTASREKPNKVPERTRKARNAITSAAVSDDETRRLFEGARLGDTQALSAFFDRSARKLLPLIRLKMGRSLRADFESRDILQAVLLKSFQRLEQVQDPGAVMGWLARMAENEIRDRADYASRQRRDVARRVPLDTEAAAIPAPVRQALSQAILDEQSERLTRALESLPDAQREIIVWRKLEELTFHEIAMKLEKSEDACRMAFSRAMAALTLRMTEPE